MVRRNYEYDHQYGLRLEGRAVSQLRTADSRSKFIEAFHSLLSLCGSFYKQDDDTTVIADGFPVLNALKEVHLILSQGAHNQYGDAAVDRAHRDADAAVDAGAGRSSASSCRPGSWSPIPSRGWTASTP